MRTYVWDFFHETGYILENKKQFVVIFLTYSLFVFAIEPFDF